ncbi:MAG: hypothetical protein IT431_05135 [Phycisphaerales bacterium]|nr:hypothetical protein [Phycisphaerales bacterium]
MSPPTGQAETAMSQGLAVGWVYVFFILLGLAGSLAAIAYAVKVRRKATALVQAISAGGVLSSGSAALGWQIAGVAAPITWAEAAVVTGIAFFGGTIFWLIAAAVIVQRMIVTPIAHRFGPAYGVRTWIEFLGGIDPLRDWINRAVSAIDADQTWDEIACAAVEVHRSIDGLTEGSALASKAVEYSALRRGSVTRTDLAIAWVAEAVGPPVRLLVSKLTRSTLNFTVWRVHPEQDCLEHLLSLPVEPGQEAGYGRKADLPIWTSSGRSQSGSLAAEAMLEGRYRWVRSTDCRKSWPTRSLGKSYDAVAAMPVPSDRPEDDPWAVICIESRNGALPLDSNTVRTLMGALARTLDALGPMVRRRTIGDVRNNITRPMTVPRPSSDSTARLRGSSMARPGLPGSSEPGGRRDGRDPEVHVPRPRIPRPTEGGNR